MELEVLLGIRMVVITFFCNQYLSEVTAFIKLCFTRNILITMFYWVKIFFLLFIITLLLFFQVEFEVYPHLPGYATERLLPSPPSKPDQVVFIIVDSLRFDYVPRFQFVKNFRDQHPTSTFLAKSRVGNPTMTTQRIESLMTGSEIFSSGNILKTFLASQVDADNIITQLNSHNKTSVILGDNTWVKLYQFNDSAVCTNTFDVHDLDTCDRVVYDNFDKYLSRDENKTNVDFIVAHLLGIDHVGHSTSSLTDPMMDVKIRQFSQYLTKIFQQSSDNTMFLVTGDHGMREDGNHGGTSTAQIQTFLFGYYKGRNLFGDMKTSVVAHSDITTTLSILLDVPLPNNAIGYPILNLLPSTFTKENITSINKNLFKHFADMLHFYKVPLSAEESDKHLGKLTKEENVNSQEIVLEYVSQKLTFLKYSAPDPSSLLTLVFVLSLLPISILFYIFFPQLYRTATQCRGQLFLVLFCEGFPMFTLFICYFSWAVIQNLSNALLCGFLIAAVFGILLTPQIINKGQSIMVVLVCFFMLSQMEPDKSNDYRPSFFRIELINDLVTSRLYLFSLSVALGGFYLKYTLEELNKWQSRGNSLSKISTYTKITITILTLLSYFFAHTIQRPFYLLSSLQSILIIVCSIALKVVKNIESEEETINSARFLVVAFLAPFMGANFPLVLAACLVLQSVIYPCYNYAIFMSLLSKCIWWWLGNRYEYSGVDILKTYVYSDSYAIALNAFSLIVYLNSPFILNFALMNCRMITPISKGGLRPEQISHLSPSSAQLSSGSQSAEQKPYSAEFVAFLQCNNMKYSGVLLLGLVSSIWTTIYNNQKILFTVVCVPVLVLMTLVTLVTVLLVVLLSYFYEGKMAKRQEQYQKIGNQPE